MAPRDMVISDIDEYLKLHQEKELLRLVVVGSVDDGKSTLIGRLLHDTHGVYEDQLSAVKRASTQTGMAIDFSLFTDGLKAEREQGITIDVAYRYFSTEKRKFIIADTPGHVQYTRNMATGASTANVAVILIDARLGVLQQSRRHAYIASLLGIPHLAVAVNKMDLPECGREVFERICGEFNAFASKLGFADVRFIPVSALRGDNIVEKSSALEWYDGETVLEYLERVPIAGDRNLQDFRYPVQYVLRPHLDYRGYAAEIASGRVARGDRVMVLPSRKVTTIASIDTFDGPRERARAPMSVALTLADNVDVSRGDMLVHPDNLPHVAARFEASLVWMHEAELDLDASYFIKHTTTMVRAEFERVVSKTNLQTLEEEPARTLGLNDIGRVIVRARRDLHFDPYAINPRTGSFIVIDTLSNATVAAGMIRGPAVEGEAPARGAGPGARVETRERHQALGQRGAVVVLTGPAGVGKTELAYAIERALYDGGHFGLVVDPADSISRKNPAVARHPEEVPASALELCERGAELGWITLLSFATPEAEGRERVRQSTGSGVYIEIHVSRPDASSSTAVRHQPPERADLVVNLAVETLEAARQRVIDVLAARGVFTPPPRAD
jgi:sulfate adenylyltransferase large subunit